jgi:hypothetical protein
MNNFDYFREFLESEDDRSSYPTTFNKDTQLHVNPHYTDKRFDTEQTIFGKSPKTPYGHKHLSYDYSDRLWQWDYKKAESATKEADLSDVQKNSCRWFEIYLSSYFGFEVEVEHIIAGVNRSSGYPYCAFGYKKKEVKKGD